MALKNRFMTFLYKAVRYLITKTRLIGTRNLPTNTPTIIVANHLGAYGPITMMSSLSFDLYPWVIQDVTRISSCPSYLRDDFIETELKLKAPLSITFSIIIGGVCVALMKGINAIPVYKKSRNMRKTIERSLLLLRERKALLIFPEIKGEPLIEGIERFDSGFIILAKRFYRRYGKRVTFVPAAVSRKARAISIGQPILFRPDVPYHEERDRIRNTLETSVTDMYLAMNKQTSERMKPADRIDSLEKERKPA